MAGYGDFSFYYDVLNVDAQYQRRAEAIHSALVKRDCSGGILCDLACGTGTLCEFFAGKGYDVIGVDISEDMLSIAQEKKAQSGSDILYLCQDMRELDLFGTIDACICTLDGINHLLTEDDVKQTFEKVSLFLNDGGLFIFDVNTPFKHEKVLANNSFVYDLDDVFCVWQNTSEPETLTTRIQLDIFETDDGESYVRTEESFSERAYPLKKLKALLCETNFNVEGIFNEFLSAETAENDERAVFVCKRKPRNV